SLVTFSWLLLAPVLASSQKTSRGLEGSLTFVSALVVLLTILPVPKSLHYNMRYWDHTNNDYAEVISRVKTLRGTVLSPEDPTITLYAREEINRSIFIEYDALGWPSAIPEFLLNELAQADYIVHAINWGPREIIRADDLVGLGFELDWDND